jgi:very-short-patch-repair endonuclease
VDLVPKGINRAKLIRRARAADTRFLHDLESLDLSRRFQRGFFTPFYSIADFCLPDYNLVVEIDGPTTTTLRKTGAWTVFHEGAGDLGDCK